MWVYRIELPPKESVRAAMPRFVDFRFHPAYKLYNSHAQRISTEPRVPMFEGFTMPPLTYDSEVNAMYKQIQCRPIGVPVEVDPDATAEELVLACYAPLFSPAKPGAVDVSVAAAIAFTEAFLEWFRGVQEVVLRAQHRLGQRQEYPSLWETVEMQEELKYKLELVTNGSLPEVAWDPDAEKPRLTVAEYNALMAVSRVENLEGLARARRSRPRRRRDEDGRLQE